jgi:ParB/RepB/Spo0J family partition protein
MNRKLKIQETVTEAAPTAHAESPTVKEPGRFADEIAQALGAPNGAALQAQVAAAVEQPIDRAASYAVVALEVLVESPTNPRKTFGNLEQLADSIKRAGLLQPLVVRLWPEQEADAPRVYEIVAGHRRYRAAKLAGLQEVPVSIRELTTEQVIELQLVENLRRENLNPIEEAEGLAALQARGFSVEQIADKLATSKGTIYARLKLLALCSEARAALLDGLLHPSVATPLARLSHRLQAKALDAPALRPLDGQPAPARAAIEWLQREYVRTLRGAPFDLKDETLLPEAGSCARCPKRTKNAPDLFDDLQRAGDACTDVSCFGEKARASWQRTTAAKQASGATVLSVKESIELYPHGSTLTSGRLVDLDATNPADSKRRSWRELLEKAEEPPKVTVAVDREWKPHELVERRAAIKALAKAGVKWAAAELEAKTKREDEKVEAKASEEDDQIDRLVTVDVLQKVAAGFVQAIDMTPGVRVVVDLLIDHALEQTFAPEEIEQLAGLEPGALEDLKDERARAKAKPVVLVNAWVLTLFDAVANDPALRTRLTKAWSIDTKAIAAARRAAAKAEQEKDAAAALFKKR